MSVLLLGSKGYLGSYIANSIDCDIYPVDRRRLSSNGRQYDYVINCIGKPDLEYCQINTAETDYSNWKVVGDIKKYYPNSKIINFSSYYVYDYSGICAEDSKVTDRYAYCRQKLFSEKENINGVTFRVGKLFGNKNSKQGKLTDYILSNDVLNLDGVYFNPCSCKLVTDVIKWEIANKQLRGVYNLANSDFTTHYKYGCFINEQLGNRKTINLVKSIPRTFHNYGYFLMSVEKLNRIVPLPSWKKDIISYINS